MCECAYSLAHCFVTFAASKQAFIHFLIRCPTHPVQCWLSFVSITEALTFIVVLLLTILAVTATDQRELLVAVALDRSSLSLSLSLSFFHSFNLSCMRGKSKCFLFSGDQKLAFPFGVCVFASFLLYSPMSIDAR